MLLCNSSAQFIKDNCLFIATIFLGLVSLDVIGTGPFLDVINVGITQAVGRVVTYVIY